MPQQTSTLPPDSVDAGHEQSRWKFLGYSAFAAGLGGNGLWMLLAPAHWYGSIPGVTGTGPLNSHFIRDIGIVYLSLAACYVLALIRRSAAASLLLIPALWLGGHAALHLLDMLAGHSESPWQTELFGIHLPAVLAALLAWRHNRPHGR